MADEPSSEPPPPQKPEAAESDRPPPPSPSPKKPKLKSSSSLTDHHTTPSSKAAAAGKRKSSALVTLTIPGRVAPNSAPKTDADHKEGGGECRSFSQLLAGAMASPAAANSPATPLISVPVDAVRLPMVAVPCFIAPTALLESSAFSGQFAMSHQAVLATVTAQAQMQLQAGYTAQAIISRVQLQQRPSQAFEDNVLSPEAEQPPSSDQKSQSAQIVVKMSTNDGFNWRKYGQKQVKSSETSRSYYRCTQTNCSAKKKVEHFQDGRIIEIIYRGAHNHDPPQKAKYSKERGVHSSGPFAGENEISALPSGEVNGSEPSPSKMGHNSGSETPEQQLHCSSDCEGDTDIKAEEDLVEEPEPKQRITESPMTCSSPIFKTVREPKVVVQTASDVGVVSDGYRWRKYGQKVVKGNPNPRSYYKCTQTGCPVRKHVERASADAKNMIITYEGQHNHDLPTLKNGSDPPATALLVAAAEAAMTAGRQDGQTEKSSMLVDKQYKTGWQQDVDAGTSEKALELGGDTALESAQTLLSIGLNSTSEGDGGNKSEVVQRTLFDENRAAVPVQNS